MKLTWITTFPRTGTNAISSMAEEDGSASMKSSFPHKILPYTLLLTFVIREVKWGVCLKRETRILLEHSVNSLISAIEHFNRPDDRGRAEIVLRNLNHSFEMLLKAAILNKGGKIRRKGENATIGFERCINLCTLDEKCKFLTNEQATTLRIINGLRDAAEHHYVLLSERELYVYSQSALNLFEDALKQVFGKSLSSYIPNRVLPICTIPPKELDLMIDDKFTQIKELISTNKRRRYQARAAIRSLELMDRAIRVNPNYPTESELNKLLKKIELGKSWKDIFPGISTVNFITEGSGPEIRLKLTKSDGIPVKLVKEGEGNNTIAVKRVDELSYYSLGLYDIANKVGLSRSKTLAIVRYLKLQDDVSAYKEITIGKTHFKRYSPEALRKIKDAIPGLDLGAVWKLYGFKPKNT